MTRSGSYRRYRIPCIVRRQCPAKTSVLPLRQLAELQWGFVASDAEDNDQGPQLVEVRTLLPERQCEELHQALELSRDRLHLDDGRDAVERVRVSRSKIGQVIDENADWDIVGA